MTFIKKARLQPLHLHQKHCLFCIVDFHQKSKAITFVFASKIFSILNHWLSSKKQGYNLCICIQNILYFVSVTFIKEAKLQPLHLHQKYSLVCIIDVHQKSKIITFAFASKYFLFCIIDFHQNSKVITFAIASIIFSIFNHWLSQKMQGYNLCICIKIFSVLYHWLSSKKQGYNLWICIKTILYFVSLTFIKN